MKVQLYLKKINQEMIDVGRSVKLGSDAAWTVSWPKECCVLDFSISKPGDDVIRPVNRGYLLRKEKEGGMFWDPRIGAVYIVDEEAYHAMVELDHGFSEQEVARRIGAPIRSVKSLTNQLKRIMK